MAVLAGLGLTSCTGPPVPSPTRPPSPAPTSVGPAPTAPPEIPEPTTTNTLPPPPAPSAPAPSTAGRLDARALPVPTGWRTVARPGGDEQGYRGNGTWVHARDPRYAAQDAITVGCREITRDDYTDPMAALEGDYENRAGEPGVGLVLDFADLSAASRWFELYRLQVEACTTTDDPLRTLITPSDDGLVDRRTYPDSEWLEVARHSGTAVTLVILSDPDQQLSAADATELLTQLRG